jgi:alpha-N-arabinofuranosidase
LYAEMVKNRSFDFPQNLMGWKSYGNVKIVQENAPFPNNPNYIILSSTGHNEKQTVIENEGFRGMGFKKGANYRFSVWAKKTNTEQNQKIHIELISANNNIIGQAELMIRSDEWKKYEVELVSNAKDLKGSLRIYLITQGDLCMDHISLFPKDTWKGRENGLRKDLAQALYDINPGVFRFPGGCIVEGTDLETRYDWKKSVGPVENRSLNENRWNYTFKHRLFTDYFQSYGMGFFEYFLLAEDMDSEPLPVVNVGLSCQYQNKDMSCHVAIDDLQPYVQDALDLIEFANGSESSTWGKVRAEMGHPKPFNLKFIGIGNEQWGQEYPYRLAVFVKAIREKYPDIKIIGSSGPTVDDDKFKHLWPEMKRLEVDLVDEHYYKSPEWFLSNAARYDSYDRKAPAVFAGEYACHDGPNKANNFYSALCEASFMTGLERNADIVHMCTYAPLFAHVDGWQWAPDMIWFDNLSMVKTPNYYVQQLYAKNKGTHTLSLTWKDEIIAGNEGLYASAVYDADEACYIVKIVNVNKEPVAIDLVLKGLSKNTILTLGECK